MRLIATLVLLAASTSLACLWDYETFVAETGTLPCVEAVAVMRPARHSAVLLQRRVDVADIAIALQPRALAARDARTSALLHLGKIDLAVQSARERAALAPNDYGSHANLGTVLTFSGELEAALVEVKAALEANPEAHFGREKFHAQFLEYLLKMKKDPALAENKDFLGLTLTNTDALTGNSAKLPKGALDAVVSMLGVYGASTNPHLLYALGDLLALQGERKLAFAAWKSALERKHPASKTILWMEKYNDDAHAAWKTTAKLVAEDRRDALPPSDPMDEMHWRFPDNYAGLWWSANERQNHWAAAQSHLAQVEEQQLAAGLPVWTEAGVAVLTTYQRRVGLRCASSEPLQVGVSGGFFEPQTGSVAPDALAWLEALEIVVAEVRDAQNCDDVRATITNKLKKNPLPKVQPAARMTVLADPLTRERFNDVFDRFALVLSKCAPKAGNGPIVTTWTALLK